jgi:hypothetical protein
MSISGNYAQPVVVNGYACWNCQQVAEAKKDIDPASSQSGAVQSPNQSPGQSTGQSPAVVFGGSLAQTASGAASSTSTAPNASPNPTASAPATVNLLV